MDPDDIQLGSFVRRKIGRTFSSLKHRNFRLYFTGQIISNTGNWLTNIALTLLVLKLTHSGLSVGILVACQYGPILLFSIWGGVIADRADKQKLLLVTQSLEMAESAGLAVLAFLPHPPVIGLLLLAIAGGIVLSLDNPLRRSFVSEMVPEEDIANAVVVNSTIVNSSRIFGPLIAGLLIITIGYGWCFGLDAVSYIAVICSIALMRPRELFRNKPEPRSKGAIRAGLHYVKSQPIIWISFIMLLIIGILSYNFSVTLPLFVADGLHKTTTTYTILYSAMSVGSIITAIFIARRQLVELRHAIIGGGALGILMLALAISPNVTVAAVVSLFVGAASILYTTSTTTLVQLSSKANMRGRVLAIQSVLLVGTTPIGGPLLGWIADSLGGRVPLILGGCAAVVAAIIGLIAGRRFQVSRHLQKPTATLAN